MELSLLDPVNVRRFMGILEILSTSVRISPKINSFCEMVGKHFKRILRDHLAEDLVIALLDHLA